MKLLAEISDRSLRLGDHEILGQTFECRKSARAILLDDKGNMATQYLNTYTYHKLPGGGVDPGERIKEALMREVKEEVGCNSKILLPVGVVIEYRDEYKLLHISYCYVARVEGDIGTPELEAGELEEGQETRWLPPSEVLERMEHDVPGKYEGHFILEREKTFLREYLRNKNARPSS